MRTSGAQIAHGVLQRQAEVVEGVPEAPGLEVRDAQVVRVRQRLQVHGAVCVRVMMVVADGDDG